MGKTKQLEAREPNMRKTGQIKLQAPPRTESIVRVPVTPGSPLVGVTNKVRNTKRNYFSSITYKSSGRLCNDKYSKH